MLDRGWTFEDTELPLESGDGLDFIGGDFIELATSPEGLSHFLIWDSNRSFPLQGRAQIAVTVTDGSATAEGASASGPKSSWLPALRS